MLAAPHSPSIALARYIPSDSSPDTDPASSFWTGASSVVASNDALGQPVPGHATEIRAQWTPGSLYLLFSCSYIELHLKPDPVTTEETNKLWNWDVAEAFIGSDSKNIRRYKEFEVSPQGEWVDLDIDLDSPYPGAGWVWQSGIQAAARIDEAERVWFAFMRIPWAALDVRPSPGVELRINFYRAQGPQPKVVAWQPTHQPTFHVPQAFGTLQLL